MIVVFAKPSLAVEQVLHVSSQEFLDALSNDPDRGWIVVEGNPPPDAIRVLADGDGFKVEELKSFAFPFTQTGGVCLWEDVPRYTTIRIGAEEFTMNTTNVFEATFEDPGTYFVSFTLDGYRPFYQTVIVEDAP